MRAFSRVLAGATALIPAAAQAHGIPLWIAAGALSPILFLILAIILGWLVRSIKVGMLHAVLLVVWVSLFWAASLYVSNDYVIWTPLLVYLLHAALLILLVVVAAVKRFGSKTR